MRSGLTICRYPDKMIAEDFLKAAVEAYSTAAGFAVAKGGVVLTGIFDPEKVILLDAIQKTQEHYKNEQVYFHLTKAEDGELTLDSLQPFTILHKGTDALLSVILEGEFPRYVKEKQPDKEGEDSAEYHFVNDYLREKIKEVYKDTGSLEKCLAKMDSATFRADIKPHLEPRGVVLVIPGRGKAFAISDNKQGGNFDWGFASKKLGFSTVEDLKPAAVVAEVKPVAQGVAKPLTFAEKQLRAKALREVAEKEMRVLKAKDQPAAPPADPKPPVVEPKKDAPVETKPVEKPNTPFIMKDGVPWCRPNIGASYKEIHKFWGRHTFLEKPKDPKEMVLGFPASTLRPNSPLYQFLEDKDKGPEAKERETAFRDAMAKAEKDKGKRAQTAADNTPGVLTTDEKRNSIELRKIKTFWDHTMDQLLEEVKPELTYSQQVGIPLEVLNHASTKYYLRLSKRELVALLHETRMTLLQTLNVLDKTTAPITKRAEEKVEAKDKTDPPFVVDKKLSFAEQRKAKAKAAA